MAEKINDKVKISIQKKKGKSNETVDRLVYPNLKGKKRIQERKEEAKERQKERNKHSPEQQLEILNKRLGKDVGANKERQKLKLMIGKEKTEKKKKANKKERTKK